jgi:6-pyruvoyl-tetrahydropterin synthase
MGDTARVTVTTYLDSAHKLPESLAKEGLTTLKCCRLHGHTYKVVVVVLAKNPRSPLVVDFGQIKTVLNELDHVYLNDVFEKTEGWENISTTAENLCDFIYWRLCKEGIGAEQITIYEGFKGENTNVVTKTYGDTP